MSVTLDGITLDGYHGDLKWTDEFLWSPIRQNQNVTVGGSLVVQSSTQLAGRPITLEGGRDGRGYFAVQPRATINALRAIEIAGREMVLVWSDARVFNVTWRTTDGPPIEAEPVQHMVPHVDEDLYTVILRLTQI